jgi:hypothetical protein
LIAAPGLCTGEKEWCDMKSGANLHMASQQWASRPDDQRFLTLEDLHKAVSARKRESWTAAPEVNSLRVLPTAGNELVLAVQNPATGVEQQLQPSNWAFGQLSMYAKAPASYLRTLPSQLACINLQWGLEHNPMREDALVLAHDGDNMLRAMTSTTYGRIWDHQVVEAVQRANSNDQWKVPAASYSTTNPIRATTLYASDRDVFIFLVDPDHPIEVEGENLFRGFYVWNSEVGSATFGLTTFLYRYVCDNRIVWGATDVKELRIRHTGGAPERFSHEGAKSLARYANESTAKVVEGIKAAKHTAIPLSKDQTVEEWLKSRFKITAKTATASVEMAKAEEGKAETVWDVVNGITAYARSIPYANERIELESKAGALMQLVS